MVENVGGEVEYTSEGDSSLPIHPYINNGDHRSKGKHTKIPHTTGHLYTIYHRKILPASGKLGDNKNSQQGQADTFDKMLSCAYIHWGMMPRLPLECCYYYNKQNHTIK